MKVAINVDNAFGPNPAYDPSQPLDEATNWPERRVPRGTVIDHPQSFLLCQGSDPRAEPVDDEAKAIHAAYVAERDKGLALREAAAPAGDEDEPAAGSEVRRRGVRAGDLTE